MGNGKQNRRDFIGHAGTGILAAPVPKLQAEIPFGDSSLDKSITAADKTPVPKRNLNAPSEREEENYFTPVSPDKKIGFAIVGIGNLTLGQILPSFGNSKYAKPVALVSGHPNKAKKVAAQYDIPEQNIYNYENFDDISDNADIDAVYIVLPNSMHAEFTIRAARAGKHVLCEKPMANSVKECEEMIDACKKANRKLMIAYRMQYEPNNIQCREWIQHNTFGKVRLLELYNGQNVAPGQWRLQKSMSGGGPMVDVGIYCLNTCRFLLAEEPEAVFAQVQHNFSDERFKEVEESMLFHLYFPGGVMASCVTTFGSHLCRRYRAFTDEGAWFGMDPAFEYKGVRIEASQAKGKLEWKSNPTMEEKNQFATELDHFATCLYDNKEPFTRGEEGLQDIQIIKALYQSAREGKIVQIDKVKGKDVYRGTLPEKES